jgi:hypothetical protein
VSSVLTIAKLAHELPADKFVLISVGDDKDERKLREFIRGHRMDWPQALDAGLENTFQVKGLPSLVLIDQEGVVRFRGWGWQIHPVISKIKHLLKR